MIQGDGELVVAQHADAAQGIGLFGDVFVVAQNVLRAVDLAADLLDLLDLGRHHQQDGERVVPRRDGRTVGILQVVPQAQEVGAVAILIFHDLYVFNDGGVDHIHALGLIPVHQVVAVDQRAHVDIRSVVADHFGKEVALHHGGVADQEFVGIDDFDFFSLRI